MIRPARKGRTPLGAMTGIRAPRTQNNWNLVSKRANDRPWFALGASRCTIASKDSLPRPAANPTDITNARTAIRSPGNVAKNPTADAMVSTPPSKYSSRTRRRNKGAATAPMSAPIALAATMSPNQMVAASSRRNQNATRNNVNPVMPRRIAIADAARTIPALRKSLRSSSASGCCAIDIRGSRAARGTTEQKTIMAAPRTHCDPTKPRSSPGPAAIAPPTPLKSTSFEFASTRSC